MTSDTGIGPSRPLGGAVSAPSANSTQLSALRQLAAKINSMATPHTVPRHTKGVVVAVDGLTPPQTVSIHIDGDTTVQIDGVTFPHTYAFPQVGDVVMVVRQGADTVILGKYAPGTATTSVTSGTSFGQASAVGTANGVYALQNHAHGTPTLNPASSVTDGTSFGQSLAVGTANGIYARQDHAHGTPAAPATPAQVRPNLTKEVIGSAVGIAGGGSNVDLGASYTFSTTSTNCQVTVIGTFDMHTTTAGNGVAVGICTVDGTDQASQATFALTVLNDRNTVNQTWTFPLPSTGSHTVKLRGGIAGTSGAVTYIDQHTGFTIMIFDY